MYRGRNTANSRASTVNPFEQHARKEAHFLVATESDEGGPCPADLPRRSLGEGGSPTKGIRFEFAPPLSLALGVF